MAKTTKKSSASSDASEPKKATAPAKKAPAAKKAAASSPAIGGAPLIDTSLAAEAAAKMIANRLGAQGAAGTGTGPQDAQKKESSAFKQLKESLAKPHSQALTGMLDKSAPPGQKRPFTPPGGKHASQGQNQTFGADVNRSG